MNPHAVTKAFEKEISLYTGAPYAVSVSSCTMALLLAVAWHLRTDAPMTATLVNTLQGGAPRIEIPKRTYVSVPMSIIHAGGRPVFRDEEWVGCYQLKPLLVFDCARWFTDKLWPILHRDAEALNAIPLMARPEGKSGVMACVSFHSAKTLGDTQGGAILHDNAEADAWLRRARFDGRTEGVDPKDDAIAQIGWHCYMSPDVAARLLLKLSVLPRHNEPLANSDYPDLSLMECFK